MAAEPTTAVWSSGFLCFGGEEQRVIEWPSLILKLLPVAENALMPGKFKELQGRLSCQALFHDIRKNHHLKRALRLSWISAAQAIVNACEEDMKRCPDRELRDDFRRYLPVFTGAMNQVREAACNLSSQQDLPDSLIDDFLYHFVESMPAHLAVNAGHAGKQYVTDRFLSDLRHLTCAPEDLPQALVTRAEAGVTSGSDQPRSFGTLMFDDFARVLQDPAAYPAANASFLQIQHDVLKELSRENLVISHRLVELVSGLDERMDQRLAQDPLAWLKGEMSVRLDGLSGQMSGVDDKVQLLGDRLKAIPGAVEERITRALKTSFGEAGIRANLHEAPSVADWHDPLMQAAAPDHTRLIHYCLFEEPARFHQIRATFHRVLENLRINDTIDLLPWHVPSIEYREQQAPRYFQNAIASLCGEQHCATVLEMGPHLGASVDCDPGFADRLDALQWQEDGEPGVDIDLPSDLGKRSKAARRGVFPLTVETHLALSTVMSGKSLRILLRAHPGEVSRPAACFLAFMERLGVTVEAADALHKDKTWVLRYLQTLLGITPSYIENPYPRLEHYTLEDAGRYHGREAERDAALALLARRRRDGKPAVLGVRGPSGCGKSSFVQARLVAALAKKGHKALTLRRTDFLGADGETVEAARLLTEKIRFVLGQPETEELATLYQGQPAFVVPSCCHHLAKLLKKAGEPRMVICMDQFEEIVDDLADGKSVPEWTSLLGIIDHLAAMPNLSIVFTLEDSRFDKLATVAAGSVVGDPEWLRLDDGHPDFLRTIVQAPLREAGFELDEAIVTRLVNEAIELDQSNGDIGSPLPLLSLKMHNLFREIRARGLDGNVDAPEKINAHTLGGVSLSIAEEIEALAEEAWRRSGAEDNDLAHFLRPLVRVSKSDAEGARTNIVLGTVKAREFATERKVDKAFTRLRLLVPAASGWRLVHESVIHRWKRSAQWFAVTKDELAREAALRKEAEAWHAQGRPACTQATADQMEAAVLVLQAQIRNWATDLPVSLPDAERHLCDYALAIFDLSDTPLDPVPTSTRGGLCVHLAASYGCTDLLRRYASIDPASLHANTKENRSPLHCSAFSQAESTAYLLAQNADLHQEQKGGGTALDIATWVQREDILDLLLAALPTPRTGPLPGQPLLAAAQVGNLAIVRRLEAAGYDHAAMNEQKWTALHCAATNDNLDTYRHFLARGNLEAENEHGLTPIDIAAANGHWKLIQASFTHEATGRILAGKRSTGWTTLGLAAEHKRYKTVEMLVPICDPNTTFDPAGAYEGYTALHLALHEYDKDRESASQRLRTQTALTVEALLSSEKTDVLIRAKGKSAHDMATGLPALQAAILAHPSFDPLRPMAEGQTELMLAAKSGDRAKVMALFEQVKSRTHIDHIAEDGTSLALLLLRAGMADLVQPLLEAGEVDPWKAGNGYPGLLLAADTPATQDLFQWILAAIPERLQPATTARILTGLIARDHARDSDGALAQQLLARTDLSGDTRSLAHTMISAVQLGRLGMFLLLEQHGLEPALPDAWGRQIEDLASDVVREALLNRRRLLS